MPMFNVSNSPESHSARKRDILAKCLDQASNVFGSLLNLTRPGRDISLHHPSSVPTRKTSEPVISDPLTSTILP
jgi:hypothetical protein